MTVLLRDIDEGIAAFNEAWDEWSDKDNLPVSLPNNKDVVSWDVCVFIC